MESAAYGEGATAELVETSGLAAAPPLRCPFLVVDDFLPRGEAEAMRGHFEAHFAEPHSHRPDVHQIWNYWYVPQLYTYLRTSPEKLMPRELAKRFHTALSQWAAERLGMGHVTWPNLSLYVDGCWQGLHNDSTNGRFGYVYSLTPDSRRSRGGETMLVREGDLFRRNLDRAQAGPGLYDLVEARFNRLTLFDDRLPHGVQRIEGSMDPLDGRLVLHGHISEAAPILRGPLASDAVWAVARPLIEAETASAEGGGDVYHGPLVVRLIVSPEGHVHDPRILVDRVARSDGGSAAPLVDRLLARLAGASFPAADGPSEATLPIMMGGSLPWMKKPAEEDCIVTSRPLQPMAKLAPFTIVPTGGKPNLVPDKPGATIGATVRERLAATPGVAKIPKETLEAFVVRDFLTGEECAGLISQIDARRIPSGLLAPHPDPEFRTSESCNLNPGDPLVAAIEARINALMGIDPSRGETMQGQRYAVGQQFKAHHDFFHTDQPYWETQKIIGGQRTWTVMAFLNKPEAGGQTFFPKTGLRITPATGYLLIWNNLDRAGEPNPYSLHQGLPVQAGIKYVVTKWYRERPWGVPS